MNLLLSKHSLLVALEAFRMADNHSHLRETLEEHLDINDEAWDEALAEVNAILNDETNSPIVLYDVVKEEEAANER